MVFFTEIFDQACPAAYEAMIASGLPEQMFVHPEVYEQIAEIRRDELANGYPLILLGMLLEADVRLPKTGFRFSS